MIITIDGLAGSGKSSVAASLAQELGFIHLNSGLIYRAFSYFAIKKGILLNDESEIVSDNLGRKFDFRLNKSDLSTEFSVTGIDNISCLYERDISQAASVIATLPRVRTLSTDIQREVAERSSLVLEGRDAGTVVFPEADFKFYLNASVKERARRRVKELYPELNEFGDEFSKIFSELVLEIEERDNRDISRIASPHVVPLNSIEIDTDKLTLQEVIEVVSKKVSKSK